MASLVYQKEAAALLLAVLGQNASPSVFDTVGNQIEKGQTTAQAYISSLLSSSAGQALYASKTDVEILQSIYTAAYGNSPTTAQLQAILAGSTLNDAISSAINSLLNYSGFDSGTLASQSNFDAQLNNVLFPGTSAAGSGPGVSDALALYYLAGIDPVTSTVITLATQINTSAQSFSQVANKFVTDRAALNSLSNTDFINKVFNEAYERAPSNSEFSALSAILSGGGTKGDVLINIITGLRGTVGSGDTAAQQFFLTETQPDAAGQLAGLAAREQVASIYLAVPQRDVDAQGLDDWSNYLGKHGNTFASLTTKLLTSVEFQKKGAQLTGTDFIQHVYTGVHGVAATPAQIALYSGLTDKGAITTAIINDLRNSTATDATTVTQQHGFEYDIGTSLLYKTAASLTATAAGGNATGTVNTGASHQISNAETAVLTNVQLNANAASLVNLKFADHLANLTINGTSAATVNLSDNGVNPGVAVTVNNGNVILNASSGSDNVVVTSTANIATGTAQFNLGAGNDSLHWAGNAVSGGANTVANTVKADGGTGTDSISANFITKTVVTNQNALGIRTSTVTSNANNFSNFEQIDLTGYIGKSVGTLITTPLIGSPTTTSVTTPTNTFDFGLTNGTSTVEGTTGGTVTQNAAATNLGTQGFVISGLANVNVINAAGGNAAQLEVKGDATSASTLNFTFVQNATDHFNINFDAVSSANVNAGAISLNSSSSALLGTALTTVNVASGGTGSFNNILSLAGTNAQVQNINVTGDHALNLTVGAGYSNVRDINASANTGGLNLDSSHAGTGDGIIVQLLNALPLSAITTALLTPLLNTLGLNGYQLTVEGTSTADSFNVLGNTTLTGGTGANIYDLKSSTSQAGVTITDFSTAKDKIVDAASGLTLSNTGTAVANYGTRPADTLDALLGSLVGGLTTGVVGLLGGILGLSNPNSLTGKVGVASVVFSGSGNTADSYVIIDNNNNHTLDANDTVIYLTGQNHQQLVDSLHYA
ncbi:beta strand repeat-containing protein [Serratia nevei]|uniref:beta strand repeat-containing protein n=1 Tax=Serratia nevei TaxID=2703794 RepID=UPI00313CE19B|nr:S-layer protein [Serratia marcescens]